MMEVIERVFHSENALRFMRALLVAGASGGCKILQSKESVDLDVAL